MHIKQLLYAAQRKCSRVTVHLKSGSTQSNLIIQSVDGTTVHMTHHKEHFYALIAQIEMIQIADDLRDE